MPYNRYYSGPQSDHFDGRFFNTAPRTPDKRLSDIRRWRRTSSRTSWPDHVAVTRAVPDALVNGPRVTLVGHATTLIQIAGLNLLTDPVWSERVSPSRFAGPKRVCEPGIRFDDLPPIDAVLLSHNHYDHLDIVTLKRLIGRDSPLIITPLGNDTIIKRAVPKARVHTSDWWESHNIGDLQITVVPAQHWSARWIRDRRMALWGGFFVRSRRGSVYFAGDTGYGDGSVFRDIRTRLGAPDVALIPIGAYAPRWFMADQHVDPSQAVDIMLDLDATQAVAIHWGVFHLTDEGRDDPTAELKRVLAEREIDPERFAAGEPGAVTSLAARAI